MRSGDGLLTCLPAPDLRLRRGAKEMPPSLPCSALDGALGGCRSNTILLVQLDAIFAGCFDLAVPKTLVTHVAHALKGHLGDYDPCCWRRPA